MKKRAHIELRATPLWASTREIYAIYNAAADRRDLGEDVQVDHIIPLTHPLVCGLHCVENLRIISARENSYKCNYFNATSPANVGLVARSTPAQQAFDLPC
jgi:hypothetical protein